MKRTAFLGTSLVAPALLESVARADGPPGGRDFVEPLSAFDLAGFNAKLGRPADNRALFEAVAFNPAVFNNVKNMLNGLQFGFGIAPEKIATAFAGHGPSSAYTYTDAIWAKYRIGEFLNLKDAAGAPLASNANLKLRATTKIYDPNAPNGAFQDTSIEALQSRGVVFLSCHTAIEEQALRLNKGGFTPAGMAAPDVAADILENLIPGAVVVPSMVAAIAYLQHAFGYAYLTIP